MVVAEIETPRLRLRAPSEQDASFFLRLLNEPSWLRFIGDRGVRTLDAARAYLVKTSTSQADPGLGIYLVELKDSTQSLPGTSVGVCTLIKRPGLEDVDIGFAFLPDYWSCGYAYEASAALLRYAVNTLGHRRIVAITKPENQASIRLLEKLDLRLERDTQLPNDDAMLHLMVYEA